MTYWEVVSRAQTLGRVELTSVRAKYFATFRHMLNWRSKGSYTRCISTYCIISGDELYIVSRDWRSSECELVSLTCTVAEMGPIDPRQS